VQFMRTLLTMKLKQWCGIAGLFAASLLFTGCGHLAYTDPNPSTPYAFPGQSPSPSYSGGVQATWPPAPAALQMPITPGLEPVNIPANAGIAVPGTSADLTGATSVFRVGDMVTVSFADLPPPGWPDWKGRVGDDGKITLPFNVTVVAVGKTPSQLGDDIRKEYVPRYFVRLTSTAKTEDRFYFVGGEVKRPDRFIYLGDMTVLRAIHSASGFTDFAARGKIELRRANGNKQTINWDKALQDPKLDLPLYPGDQIIVPKRNPLSFK
jgi:hypothetical protein